MIRTRPQLSLIFATRNRAQLLERTLNRMVAQNMAGLSFEVIVADNGSTDETPAVLERFRDQLAMSTVTEPAVGKNRAMNAAIPLARGELYVFTDDDIDPGPLWLTHLHGGSRRWRS